MLYVLTKYAPFVFENYYLMSIHFGLQLILCPLYFDLPRTEILSEFFILLLCYRQLMALKQRTNISSATIFSCTTNMM